MWKNVRPEGNESCDFPERTNTVSLPGIVADRLVLEISGTVSSIPVK